MMGASGALGIDLGSKLGENISNSISNDHSAFMQGYDSENYEVNKLKQQLLEDPEYQRAYKLSQYDGEKAKDFIAKCTEQGLTDPTLIKNMMMKRDTNATNEKELLLAGKLAKECRTYGYKREDVKQELSKYNIDNDKMDEMLKLINSLQ